MLWKQLRRLTLVAFREPLLGAATMTSPGETPHDNSVDDRPPELDPIFVHARREAVVILMVFFVCLTWSVGFYVVDGLQPPGAAAQSTPTVWGLPRWVFWGLLCPWLAVDVFTFWFCFYYMKNDDLDGGSSPNTEGEPGHE